MRPSGPAPKALLRLAAARGTSKLRRLLGALTTASVAFALSGCGETQGRLAHHAWSQLRPPPDSVVFLAESLVVRYERAMRDSAIAVHYRPYVVHDTHAIWRLRLKIGAEALATALRVSRLDLQHVSRGDTLVVPDKIESPLLSPYPVTIPAARVIPKLLLVSLRVQAFAAYERGRLVRWGPTSTGRRDKPTPAGLYYANWKAKERQSTIDDDWVLKWAVNLDSGQGIAVHEYGLPGRPASHSCVRLAEEDAEWCYGWVKTWRVSRHGGKVVRQGTPVVVFGGFAYGQRRPWIRLLDDPNATRLAAQELDETVADYFYAGPPAPYWVRLTPIPVPEPPKPPVIAERDPHPLDSRR